MVDIKVIPTPEKLNECEEAFKETFHEFMKLDMEDFVIVAFSDGEPYVSFFLDTINPQYVAAFAKDALNKDLIEEGIIDYEF